MVTFKLILSNRAVTVVVGDYYIREYYKTQVNPHFELHPVTHMSGI